LAEDSLTVVGEPVVSEPYAVAVRKDNVRLLRAIEKGLAAMAQDGTLDTLVAQWLRDHQ
jgi:ABC-type amino acid transport substrate-binding protein